MILAGQILGGRFEVKRRIGSGGMGEVFEVIDRVRDDVCAIKTLTRADGAAFARFKREFRALQSTSHPNLVSLGELVCVGDLWMFTMELVAGRHFLEHVRGDHQKLRDSLGQLVVGLCALHQGGLVHRDVKPSNVMVNRDGRVVILDFGLVTTVDPARQSIADGPIGTIEYMAPEQASGRQVDEAADWYSVGVMLYEALTGQMPHKGHALEILLHKQQVDPPAAHIVAPDAPRDLCDLCMELLAIEPRARPSGAAIARRLGVDAPGARQTSTSTPTPVFVGRESERAALHASAEAARTRPRVHLVIGESGIGKSELVARFVRTLATDDQGAMILAGRCYERESVPFKAFDGVADGLAQLLAGMTTAEVRKLLPERPELLVRLFPVFQRVEAIASAPAGTRDAGEPHEQRRRMFVAFRALVANLAATCRVVITIDDLQWADADSFLLLRELLRGSDAPPILVIATVRGEVTALETELEDLPVERTHIGPLTDEECRELAERLVPGAAARFDLERVSREAGGHPMFLHEILRHLDLAGAQGAAGATLDDALSARVALLRPDARSVLAVVCIAGAPISLEVAEQACRLDATALTRAVASLRVATLVRETRRGRFIALEPYHDRVRESVEGRIAADIRRDLHSRIAFALEAAGEPRDPQLLLRNFQLAEVADRAARYAEEAALRSEAAHAFDQAAELWKTALDAIPREPADRTRVRLRLGQALVLAGRGAEAAKHYLAAAEGADRATRLECHLHAAEQLVVSGHISPGIHALETLLSEIGVASPKTTNSMLVSLLWHRAQIRVRGLGFRERHRREIADATRLELEVLKVAAYSLSMIDVLRGMDFQTRHLRMALKIGDREHIARALLLQAIHHATASDHRTAQHYIDRAIAVTDPSDPLIRAMVPGVRAACVYFAGDLVKAVSLADEAIAMFRQAPGNSWESSSIRLFQMFAMRYVGDYVDMRAKYEAHKQNASERGDRYLESTLRRVCVTTFLADNDPRGAVRELVRATWVPPAGRFHVQHFHELMAWCEIGLYRGVFDERAQIADRIPKLERSMLLRVESVRLQYDYLRGRLALAGQLPETEATRAYRRLHKEKNPLAVVWALALEAGTHTGGRDPERAASLYEQAADAAGRVSMHAIAAASRLRVAELRGDAELRSSAEAELVGLGVRQTKRMCSLLVPTRKVGGEPDETTLER